MSVPIRIEEYCPLGQKCIPLTKGVFDGPVHSKSELSLPAGNIDSFLVGRYFIEYGSNLNWGVRKRKAQLNAASGKRLSGLDSHRSNSVRKENSLHRALFEKNRTDTSPQVRANLHANLVVFDRNHAVVLQNRPPAGLAEALVGIESIRVARCGNRTCWDQAMRQQTLCGLCKFKHCRTEPSRLCVQPLGPGCLCLTAYQRFLQTTKTGRFRANHGCSLSNCAIAREQPHPRNVQPLGKPLRLQQWFDSRPIWDSRTEMKSYHY